MVLPAGFEPAASSSRTRRAGRCATASVKWWRRWDSNPYGSLARRTLCLLSYIPVAFPAGFEPASAGLEAAILALRRRKPMGQPASLELASRRWQRRALPVELCLPCTCHIPSCKRTVRLFRSHCRSGTEAFPLPQKNWYPTRDSNPELHVSETCAYPDSASGANKKPGDLAVQPGL